MAAEDVFSPMKSWDAWRLGVDISSGVNEVREVEVELVGRGGSQVRRDLEMMKLLRLWDEGFFEIRVVSGLGFRFNADKREEDE